MAHPNEELIRRTQDALETGKIDEFFDAHTDDVVMHVAGRNPLAGEFHGKQELQQAFQKQMEALDEPPQFELHDAFGSDDHAVILATQRAKRGGKTLESNLAVVTHVRDGKFSEVWILFTDPYEADEFLS